MRIKSISAFLVFLILVPAVLHASPKNSDELKNIPLEWKPTDTVSSLDAIDLTPFLKTSFTVKPFTDLRKNPEEIGKNIEKRVSDIPLVVTTKDNVAEWLTNRVAQVLSEFDLTVAKDAPLAIEADVVKFYVTEESMYKADVGLKFRLRKKSGDIVWEGMVTGSTRRWGASYKAGNYYESLSNALISTIYALLQNDSFKQAVEKNTAVPAGTQK